MSSRPQQIAALSACFSAGVLVLATIALSCAHGACDEWTFVGGCRSKWALPPDPSVRCPNFYETVPTRIAADGGIFELDDLPVQALQVATEDFFDGPRPVGRPCSEGRGAYSYRVVVQGDVVFVKIAAKPRRCGKKVLSDEGATYAIASDGKILHRHLGASLFDDYEGDPDGGHPASPSQIDVFEGDAPVALSADLFTLETGTSSDAGLSLDAGICADAGTDPDGGAGSGAAPSGSPSKTAKVRPGRASLGR